MFSLIEAREYRSLRYIRQPLDRFHVLVGPNASGKTTFLDVIAFLGQIVSEGLDAAISERTTNFKDLVWLRSGGGFELAVEAKIPRDRRDKLENNNLDTVRYEVVFGIDPDDGQISILSEKVLLKQEPVRTVITPQRDLFPSPPLPPGSIVTAPRTKGIRTTVNKIRGGNDNFHDETGRGWDHSFKLGPRRSALANLPDDESKFPVSTWLKGLFFVGVQKIVLNSLLIRRASPPGQIRGFKPDGSNLPWVVESLARSDEDRFRAWVVHVRSALPDIKDIRTVEREDDRHRYLIVRYAGDLEVPSWLVSDGTLRLLALTLPAYLPGISGVYLIEEPENGIHPRAVETMIQSLSSVYDAQVLMATHSPVILSVVEPSNVLCFSKTAEGATDIVRGTDHPALRDWRGEENLGVLFAAGVLG